MDESTHNSLLRKFGVLIPPADRDRILAVIDEAEQRMRGLGPSHPELRTLEDGRNGRKVTETVQPAGGLELAEGLVDGLWELYLPHFGRGKLMDLAEIIQENFRFGPLMWFSGDARQRIKESEQRAFDEQPAARLSQSNETSREEPGPGSKAPTAKRKQARGPRPKTEDHEKLANIVEPYGTAWKEDENLWKICQQADGAKVFIPAKEWSPIRTWKSGYKKHKDKVIKVIRSRLKKIGRIPATEA